MKYAIALVYLFFTANLPASPLQDAVLNSDLKQVEISIKSGENINLLELYPQRGVDYKSRMSALHYAAYSNNLELAKLLIRLGAKIDVNNDDHYDSTSPLEYAIKEKNLDMVRFLLDSGANPEAFGHADWPLYSAAGIRNHEILKLLIKHGAALDDTGVDCRGAIHNAIHVNDLKAVEILLQAGADPNLNCIATEGSGTTPLERAKDNNNKELQILLKNYGAKELNELFRKPRNTKSQPTN